MLLAFCTLFRYAQREYSYDATVRTFNKKGEIEPDVFFIQVKSTSKIEFSAKHNGYRLELEKRDMELWLDETWPVLVVLYDGENDIGYFVELHEYFKKNRLILQDINKYKSIYLSADNVFTPETIIKYHKKKNNIHEIFKSLQRHGTDLW